MREWPSIVNGIDGFDDLPVTPRALSLLARASRLYQPTPADRIREQARLKPEDSPAAASMPETVERMAEFEQRFGGLWYTILRERENGMEYGLEGDFTIFHTGFGPAFRGILDGTWTWPVHILHDGRTLMRLGERYPDRVIDSSVIQRIESDALLAVAGRWAHHRYTFAVASDAEPAVDTEAFPPAVPEATGPTKRWWFDGDRAVFLRLKSWWTRRNGTASAMAGPDRWTMWYFTRAEADLAWASGRHTEIAGTPVPDKNWCVMCLQSTPENLACKPIGSQ
jgi:hypothetical protein